jgi:hypothetical protein
VSVAIAAISSRVAGLAPQAWTEQTWTQQTWIEQIWAEQRPTDKGAAATRSTSFTKDARGAPRRRQRNGMLRYGEA